MAGAKEVGADESGCDKICGDADDAGVQHWHLALRALIRGCGDEIGAFGNLRHGCGVLAGVLLLHALFLGHGDDDHGMEEDPGVAVDEDPHDVHVPAVYVHLCADRCGGTL